MEKKKILFYEIMKIFLFVSVLFSLSYIAIKELISNK